MVDLQTVGRLANSSDELTREIWERVDRKGYSSEQVVTILSVVLGDAARATRDGDSEELPVELANLALTSLRMMRLLSAGVCTPEWAIEQALMRQKAYAAKASRESPEIGPERDEMEKGEPNAGYEF